MIKDQIEHVRVLNYEGSQEAQNDSNNLAERMSAIRASVASVDTLEIPRALKLYPCGRNLISLGRQALESMVKKGSLQFTFSESLRRLGEPGQATVAEQTLKDIAKGICTVSELVHRHLDGRVRLRPEVLPVSPLRGRGR
ncbi:hypothetical protein N9L68_08115 [bacterium]|nr:hypothetical protein [bacterium]